MDSRQPSVLVLDDELAVRESFVDYFEDRGWIVLQAGSAEEALDILAREAPAAAVVDIRLPGMDGNAFLRIVHQRHPEIACLVCTGSPDYHTPTDLVGSAQVSRVVFRKPVDDLTALEEALRSQIEQCCGRKDTHG